MIKNILKLVIGCWSFLPLMTSCHTAEKEKFDLLIVNASVPDIETGQVAYNQLIGIRQDTIRLVSGMKSVSHYGSEQTIDAKNGFVIPGLWDMHVHFRGGDSLITENRNLLPLFLSYGVTTVRDAGGDLTPSVLKWRRAIKKQEMVGPDIFTSGPKLDGLDPYWPGSIPVADTGAVGPALDSLQQLGVDYVKTYDSELMPEMYYGIIRAAEKRGMKVTGHMPLDADLMHAVELGLDGVEHLYYMLGVTSPVSDSLRGLHKGYNMLPELVDTYNPELAKQAFNQLGTKGFYNTPTLYIGKVLAELNTTDHSQDSLLAVIGPGIQKSYERRIRSAQNRNPEQERFASRLQEHFKSLVVPMYAAGINLVAGSDCGAYNSFVYPGASLHSELSMLVEAGLTPQEALKTAVINGPKFFGLSVYYGGVAAGKTAQLLILGNNPLDNIQNLDEIEWVVKGDAVYPKSKLQAMRMPDRSD